MSAENQAAEPAAAGLPEAASAALPKPFRPQNLGLTTIGLSLAVFMQVLDTTIANVSLPTIAGNLGVSADQSAWVITSYAVSNAIALPLTGFLTRRFGEVRLFLTATILFTLASFLCGIAVSMPMLLLFRVLQGAVAGPMYPITQSLMISIFPPDRRAQALSLLATVAVVAPIAGPLLGGWITGSYSWRWIFFINLPVGIFATLVVYAQMSKKPETVGKPKMDYVGLVALVIGVGALQILLDKGNDLDWFGSNLIVGLAIVATLAIAVFVIWELTDREPIVDLRLFRYRNFAAGTLVLVMVYSAYFAMSLLLPLWLQTRLNYTSAWAGLAGAPIGVMPLLLVTFVARYAPRFDLRLVAGFAFLVFASTSFWRASFNNDVDFGSIAFVQLLQGLGVALFFMPVTTILLSDLSNREVAAGSGLSTFLRTLGGSFAASLTTFIWNRRAIEHHARIIESLTEFNPATRTAIGTFNHIGPRLGPTLLDQAATAQAYMLSTIDFFTLMGWMFISLTLLIWLAKPPFGRQGGNAGAGAH